MIMTAVVMIVKIYCRSCFGETVIRIEAYLGNTTKDTLIVCMDKYSYTPPTQSIGTVSPHVVIYLLRCVVDTPPQSWYQCQIQWISWFLTCIEEDINPHCVSD